jgi:transcriptional regulator with XRE-family HTH domain
MGGDVMKDLGSKLRDIRKANGFPQKLIADHLGLHRTNYSRIENNLQKLTPEQIALFCNFCNVSADYLLGVEVDQKKLITIQDKEDLLQKLEEIKNIIK